jgi:hypothetical protein
VWKMFGHMVADELTNIWWNADLKNESIADRQSRCQDTIYAQTSVFSTLSSQSLARQEKSSTLVTLSLLYNFQGIT